MMGGMACMAYMVCMAWGNGYGGRPQILFRYNLVKVLSQVPVILFVFILHQ
jgi:hypothetical protein